jgi:hypothetical protein
VARTVRRAVRYLLPLSALLAAPLLGGGGFARAGFVVPTSAINRPHIAFLSNDAPPADLDNTSMAVASEEGRGHVEFQRDGGEEVPPSLRPHPGAAPTSGAGQSSSGGPGAGGSYQHPAAADRPQSDPTVVVGFLFLEEGSRRPPPFPSRLFRPPRLPAGIGS